MSRNPRPMAKRPATWRLVISRSGPTTNPVPPYGYCVELGSSTRPIDGARARSDCRRGSLFRWVHGSGSGSMPLRRTKTTGRSRGMTMASRPSSSGGERSSRSPITFSRPRRTGTASGDSIDSRPPGGFSYLAAIASTWFSGATCCSIAFNRAILSERSMGSSPGERRLHLMSQPDDPAIGTNRPRLALRQRVGCGTRDDGPRRGR